MKISYGISDNNIDVTDISLTNLANNNIVIIPPGDSNRANYFTDPCPFIHKYIFIEIQDSIKSYDERYEIRINISNNTITTTLHANIDEEARSFHSHLKINHGSFDEEFPEQKMAVRYLSGNENVLEIGGNIGRNSLVIANILRAKNNNNFVTLESHPEIVLQLIENRNLNNFNFHIENSALSKRKLIQKGWDTIEGDDEYDGWKRVNIITVDELQNKYNIVFDTLILDCEGAFYYILMDMPEILNNVNLIIMENDYFDINKKQYIDDKLRENNFYVEYQEAGGWGPCYDRFFEVWKR